MLSYMVLMARLKFIFFIFLSIGAIAPLECDVISTQGEIKFDVDADGSSEAVLNNTGLGVGVTPSSANLVVNGNAIVTESLTIGSSESLSSNLNVRGTLAFSIQMVSDNVTLGQESIVLVDTIGGDVTLTLPSVANNKGKTYIIKKSTTSGNALLFSESLIDSEYFWKMNSGESSPFPYMKIIAGDQKWHILDQSGISLPIVASENLVGRWNLNERAGTEAKDSSIYAGNGSLVNGAAFQSTTPGSTYALYLDGTNDYMSVPDSAELDLANSSTQGFTIMCWLKRGSDSGNWERVIMKATTSGGPDYWLQITNSDKLGGGFNNTAGDSQSLDNSNGTSVPINTWVHASLRLETDGEMTIFYDGVADKNTTATGFPRTSTNELWIGRLRDLYDFNGHIRDVRIYNRSLTDAEINSIFQAGILTY